MWYVFKQHPRQLAGVLVSSHKFKWKACLALHKVASKGSKTWLEWRDD